VAGVKQTLELGLAVVAAVGACSRSFIAERLDQLTPLVSPLLASPLVGEGAAYEAMLALARCLPPPLATAAVPIAVALRLVEMSAAIGAQGAASKSQSRLVRSRARS
jgi:hypothetical protein